ncbi:hypothetical protein GCM10007362_28340 [Saccharibacillus endophyticus]|uniref:Uncharacterized protein n=1 Tax=Saccharibacillus endophyticus TaxID=2060666 RepID=A0ABQ1ZVC4_9BACL|nr:hypothetical protein GCM10007362_28340 [Saccharibacillus endophyticus]
MSDRSLSMSRITAEITVPVHCKRLAGNATSFKTYNSEGEVVDDEQRKCVFTQKSGVDVGDGR